MLSTTARNARSIVRLALMIGWSLGHLLFALPLVVFAGQHIPPAFERPVDAKSDYVHRRCIGQVFSTYKSNAVNHEDSINENKGGKRNVRSMLNWLHDHTSCDILLEPPFASSSTNPSRKRKKKTIDSNDAVSSVTKNSNSQDLPYHVVIPLMESHPIHQEIVIITSGLLVAGINVTIFYISRGNDTIERHQNRETTANKIRSEVLSGIPPNNGFIERARDSFSLVELTMPKNGGKVDNISKTNICPAAHPLQNCAIDEAPSILKLLSREIDAFVGSETNEGNTKIHSNIPNARDSDCYDFVMMMDASFLGGLLYSEIKMVPTIAIGSQQMLTLAMEHNRNWGLSPLRSTLDRMDRIFLQRLDSLGLTIAFLRANWMRRSLGFQELNRLKSPIDFFQPQSMVAMLVDIVSTDTTFLLSSSNPSFSEMQPNNDGTQDDDRTPSRIADRSVGVHGYTERLHNLQPLLSPCTLCLNQSTSWNNEKNATVIMVAPPAGVSAKWVRSLIRALTLTKQALEGYDECHFDRATCQNRVVGFEVNWLVFQEEGSNPYFPPIVPSFIHTEASISTLDSAIRHPSTIVALIHCNSESNILLALGVEVFCVSQNDRTPTFDFVGDQVDEDVLTRMTIDSLTQDRIDPKQVATELLRVLRRKSIEPDISNTEDNAEWEQKRRIKVARLITSGLERTVAIVRATARAHRQNKWENLEDMQRIALKAISECLDRTDSGQQGVNSKQVYADLNNDQKIELHDSFSIFIAWIIFLSSSFYVLFKDSAVVKRWRTCHSHHHKSGFFDTIRTHASDLDDAWGMLLAWSADFAVGKTFSIDHDVRIPVSGENVAGDNGSEQYLPPQHSSVRRRRRTRMTR